MNATIICGIVAITIVLALIAYQLFNLTQKLFKKGSPTNPTNPRIDLDSGDQDEAYDRQRRRERSIQFFTKYANIKDSDYRTTTLNTVILDALRNVDFVRNVQIQKSLNRPSAGDQPITKLLALQDSFGENISCSIHNIDRATVSRNDGKYEAYIEEDLKIKLKALCRCTDGEGYCPWEVEMLERYIFDTTFINLISIEIFKSGSNQPLSTSALNDIEYDGKYAVAQMSNIQTLKDLSPCTKLRVILKWQFVGSSQRHCVTLFNQIPCGETQKIESQNGVLEPDAVSNP